MRTRVLDQSNDINIASLINEALEVAGYNVPEENIPALVQAIIVQAELTRDPETALDEASDLLADGVIG